MLQVAGSWTMTAELEKLLGIDFSVCRQLLIGAGLTSLGKNQGVGERGRV